MIRKRTKMLIASATVLTIVGVAGGGAAYAQSQTGGNGSVTSYWKRVLHIDYEETYSETRPGWGNGDPNHTHTGPPGLSVRPIKIEL